MKTVTVVGGGFAGVEAAWALANRGVHVRLYEMRPTQMTPAHTTEHLAELVCSNSLKSNTPESPAGQLKTEMRALGSLVLHCADWTSVPGGQALAVDRDAFGELVTARIGEHPNIELIREPWRPSMLDGLTIIATGPLTSEDVASWLAEQTGREHLYFFDAVSPTVEASSLDRSVVFGQSRWDKGEADDYLNCPFEKDSYLAFVEALRTAERAPFHAFEAGGRRDGEVAEHDEAEFLRTVKYFAGCTPIEAIADKGVRSLAFGNFKPVGLEDPRTGRRPYAALQLRPENREKTLYSLVACQTRWKWGEQKRVFRMVPGLENAEFVRYGVIHRNTFLDAPRCLSPLQELNGNPNVMVAGQLTGVEGYVESAANGLLAGLIAWFKLMDEPFPQPPRETAYGSLASHLQDNSPREFAPMNINWGLFPDGPVVIKDKAFKRETKILNANRALSQWVSNLKRAQLALADASFVRTV